MSVDKLGATSLRHVQHVIELRAAEQTVLAGALNLNEVSAFLHHHVEIDLRAGVLFIRQVQAHVAIDDANGDRSDGIQQGLARDDAFLLEVSNRICLLYTSDAADDSTEV